MIKLEEKLGMEFKELISKEIQNQMDVYQSNPDRIVADYNNEVETINEYNGRQIFELLQNADDEKSEDVLIEINTEDNIFKISNKGSNCEGFSIGGFKSLMLPNFSPKTSKKYIGNKGLGFRSIVNWSKRIAIKSRNIEVVFSKRIVSELYDKICDKETQKKIAEDRNLSSDVKPIAFLSIPEISEYIQNEWATIIEIKFRGQYTQDIIDQINSISDEILLFVNHINRLTVIINGKERVIERVREGNQIYVNEKLWNVFSESEKLDEDLWDKSSEPESYELKLAIPDVFDVKSNFLYSYLPTKVNVDFPFIIHGTFDLNSSRNDLNDSKKNRYILKKLINLIIATAMSLTNDEVSYKALEFLSHHDNNTTLKNLGFYTEIDDSIEGLEIFPCVDNLYRKKSDVIYSNAWSDFIVRTSLQQIVPKLLLPYKGDLSFSHLDNHGDIDVNDIQKLSDNVDNLDARVELISLINETIRDKKISLLVDKNNELIPLSDDVYTPITKDYDIDMPDFVRIRFINNDLYNKLIDKFEIVSDRKTRDLQGRLRVITNIQNYEPAEVIRKIITSTNNELKKENVSKSEVLQKMVFSLYENYKILDETTTIRETTLIQLFSKDGSIVKASELYLSKTFPSGKLTELLFCDIFEENRFLADIETFSFDESEEVEYIESFFIWLGVNKRTKFSDVTHDKDYEDFIFEKIDKPSNFNGLSSFNQLKIECLEEIVEGFKENNQYDKFILWILSDEKLHAELITQIRLKYTYYRTEYYLHDVPSYIRYQLCSSGMFEDYLITNENISALVNDLAIDFNFELLNTYNINRQSVEGLILHLGAVDSFEDLSISRVREVINKLPISSPDGKNTLTIYKDSIDHYKKNNLPLSNDKILLCAKKKGELGYYPSSDVYYNGHIKLPNKIADSVPVLNYPRRQSTKDVTSFFGVKDLKLIEISIQEHTKIEALTQEFQNHLKKILPYILVYRFESSVTELTRKKDLGLLKKINIRLCDHVEYKIDEERFELENYDYVKDDKTYFIKVEKHKAFDTLRKELNFRDTFADIVGTIFDITDTEKFSRLMSDDVQESEMIIKRNIGSELINRANSYLGIADEFQSFWKVIYLQLGKGYNFDSDKNLLKNIKEDLGIKADIENINYKELDALKSCEKIEIIFNELELVISDFNDKDPYYRLDFSGYHKQKLKGFFHTNFYNFKQTLYSWCQSTSKEKEFLNLLGKYEHNTVSVEKNKLSENYQAVVESYVEDCFDFSLKEVVDNKVDIDELYERNKSQVNFELVEGSYELMSLLYFGNKVDEINKITEDTIEPAQEDEPYDEGDDVKPIIPVSLTIPPIIKGKKGSQKKPGKHSVEKDKQKKRSGDSAEKDVYATLVHDYGKENVEWISKYDDSSGYDFWYRNREGAIKYVEVKNYSNGKFYLSKNEKSFAEDNIASYEIFLVGDEIFKISDIDFSNDERFKLLASEFEVYYKLKR